MVRYAEWREIFDPDDVPTLSDRVGRIVMASFAGVLGAFFCFGVGAVPAFIWYWRMMERERASRSLGSLRAIPSPVPQHICHLVLSRSGAVYGRDVGLVSFVDGVLLFEGRRTSFSVPLDDPRRRGRFDSRIEILFAAPPGRCLATLELDHYVEANEDLAAHSRGAIRDDASIVYPPWEAAPPRNSVPSGLAIR